MKKHILTFGLVGGLVVSLFFLGPIVIAPESYMQPDSMASGELIGYSIMILAMLSVFFGVRHIRRKQEERSFSFGRALTAGLGITLVACLVFYVANIILYEWVAPDFLSEFSVSYKEYLVQDVETEEEKQSVLQKYEASAGLFTNSFAYAGIMAATTLFIGVTISLLTAAFLQRKA